MAKVTAVIPVRGGSRRLPNKNILPFGDSNLLVHKIRQLKLVAEIDDIVVSSDSDIMLDMARREGVIVQKRPDEYCDEKTKTFNEVVEYVASHTSGDHMIWAPCVCPLVTPAMYSDAIQKYFTIVVNGGGDSLVSVKLFKEYLWGESGPINYTAEKHVPSQQLPDWKVIINGFYMASREDMVDWKYFFGKNPAMYVIDKDHAIDIDDGVDFAMAELLYKKMAQQN